MTELTDDQIKEIRNAFNLFDTDNSGFITTGEMGAVMRSMGQLPTEAELYDMVDEIDIDGDGEIDFQEFLTMMATRFQNLNDESQLKEAFKVFDRDDDGFITGGELKIVMTNLGERFTEKEFDDMFREIDADNDGKISLEEFICAARN